MIKSITNGTVYAIIVISSHLRGENLRTKQPNINPHRPEIVNNSLFFFPFCHKYP